MHKGMKHFSHYEVEYWCHIKMVRGFLPVGNERPEKKEKRLTDCLIGILKYAVSHYFHTLVHVNAIRISTTAPILASSLTDQLAFSYRKYPKYRGYFPVIIKFLVRLHEYVFQIAQFGLTEKCIGTNQ